jgi:hypothetical protein
MRPPVKMVLAVEGPGAFGPIKGDSSVCYSCSKHKVFDSIRHTTQEPPSPCVLETPEGLAVIPV